MLGSVSVKDLGIISYKEAEDYQLQMLKNVSNNPDKLGYLILLEHYTVITSGKAGDANNLLVGEEFLKKKKIEFHKIGRGGDFTLHSLGQLIAYPILNLEFFGKDLNKYIRRLEQVIIDLIKSYGIDSITIKGKTGVWLSKEKKICSIGLKVSRWITMHGLALNVNNDLSLFKYILPCGIKGINMTSLSKELNRDIQIKEVKNRLKNSFSSIFDVELQ